LTITECHETGRFQARPAKLARRERIDKHLARPFEVHVAPLYQATETFSDI
jgi:hypothetical protein